MKTAWDNLVCLDSVISVGQRWGQIQLPQPKHEIEGERKLRQIDVLTVYVEDM